MYLGLQYLLEEEKNRGSVEPDRRQTLSVLTDLQQACDSAIEVLNDMLTYDKIEDRALQLDRTKFGVREFLDEIVHSFDVQVRCWL